MVLRVVQFQIRSAGHPGLADRTHVVGSRFQVVRFVVLLQQLGRWQGGHAGGAEETFRFDGSGVFCSEDTALGSVTTLAGSTVCTGISIFRLETVEWSIKTKCRARCYNNTGAKFDYQSIGRRYLGYAIDKTSYVEHFVFVIDSADQSLRFTALSGILR